MTHADLDHTSFAVRDALSWGRRVRAELGGTPIVGEELPEFRYLLMYVGDEASGSRVEFIDPTGPGFVTDFLDRRGEGPHHITFMVNDLRGAVVEVRSLGFKVVGENYGHEPWQEAFIAPDAIHGCIIQLAQSTKSYPSPAELLSTEDRNPGDYPGTEGAVDATWWTSIWETPAGGHTQLGPTVLRSTDLDRSRELFQGALGAQAAAVADGYAYRWPSGSVELRASTAPGITGFAPEPSGFTVP